MSRWDGTRAGRFGEAARWACAGAIVLGAHAGVAAWLLREPPVQPAENMPPAAIMIELATMAEAVETEETEITPDQETSEASTPVEEVETPEETPQEEPVEEVAEAEPIEEVAEAEPEQPTEEEVVEEADPAEQELAALPDAEVPLPMARPKPPEKKPEVRKEARKKPDPVEKPEPRQRPVKQRQQERAASKPAVQAQAQVRRSNRNAGRQSAAGLFSSVSPARWQSRLQAHLERRKRYPSGAGGEPGTVHVRFRIDDGGNVLSASLARSSGNAVLDEAALALVRRASPVPAPPPGVNKNITAPVRFQSR